MAAGWEAFMGSFWSLLSVTANANRSCVSVRNPAMDQMQDSIRHKNKAGAYFTAMAPTRDSKILNPSVPPNSASLERSG